MWYNEKQAVKKTGRGSYRKWKGKKMKKKLIAAIAGVFLIGSLTGCSSQLSNEYITIKQYKGLEVRIASELPPAIERAFSTVRASDCLGWFRSCNYVQ